MKVLIACEESQTECMAFRKLGHEAYSCDIQDCSGGHPEWHIKADVLPLLNGNVCFVTCDGKLHFIFGEWDLIIAHPPCTYLTVTGNRWFNEERYGERAKARKIEREIAAEFFMHFVHANCFRIAVENPIGYMSTYYRKPDQISQPYWFGDPERKSTCFWLKNLPPPCAYKYGRTCHYPVQKRKRQRQSVAHGNDEAPSYRKSKSQIKGVCWHGRSNGSAMGLFGKRGVMLGNPIENPTEQITGYACEIALAVREVMEKFDLPLQEAIEIVRIGAYNIRTEVFKHTPENIPPYLEVSILNE